MRNLLTYSWKPASSIISPSFLQTWKRRNKPLGFLNPPEDGAIAEWEGILRRWQGRINDYCLLGIGGSALPARALVTFFTGPMANVAGHGPAGRPRLWILDSVDPATMRRHPALEPSRLRRVLFHVVSKSGKTLEVAAIKNHILALLRKNGLKNWSENFLVTTSPEPGNPLEAWAHKYKIPILPLANDIGGRFCSFSPVTYTAGSLLGLDLSAISHGAKEGGRDWTYALDYAQFLARHIRQGKSLLGLFIYGAALSDFGDLLLQLFAESLGKDNKGITPLKFMGTKDQHSLLQLYLGGPKDKIVTILGLRQNQAGPLARVLWASQEGVAKSLQTQGVPCRRLIINEHNERSWGYLVQFFHLATIALGHLLKVNPFDQPMVELQKKFTSQLLRTKT